MSLRLQLLGFHFFVIFGKGRENVFQMTRRDTESAIKKHKTTTVPRGNNFVMTV